MHYEIRSQKSSSSDSPTTASRVARGGTGSRPRAIEKARTGATAFALRGTWLREGGEGTAIPVSPQRPHPLPLCRSMRAVAPRPRQRPRRSGNRATVRCAIPRTYRWAGAATPTQRNTTQALDRARMASDMIKISNTTSENKPPWLLGEVSEPTRASLSGAPAGAAQAAAQSTRRATRRPRTGPRYGVLVPRSAPPSLAPARPSLPTA